MAHFLNIQYFLIFQAWGKVSSMFKSSCIKYGCSLPDWVHWVTPDCSYRSQSFCFVPGCKHFRFCCKVRHFNLWFYAMLIDMLLEPASRGHRNVELPFFGTSALAPFFNPESCANLYIVWPRCMAMGIQIDRHHPIAPLPAVLDCEILRPANWHTGCDKFGPKKAAFRGAFEIGQASWGPEFGCMLIGQNKSQCWHHLWKHLWCTRAVDVQSTNIQNYKYAFVQPSGRAVSACWPLWSRLKYLSIELMGLHTIWCRLSFF